MVVDAFCSSPWYVDHVRPIWLALPESERGTLYVSHVAARSAAGLPAVAVGRPTSHNRPTFVVSFGDYRAARMCSRTAIALGQHGAGQSYSSNHRAYPGGAEQGGVGLFLVPNEHAAERTRRAYPHARVEVVGCPRTATLPRKERDGEPVVAISFHWDSPTIAPEMASAFAWYQRTLPIIAKRWTVLGHAHPRMIAKLGRFYQKAGIEVVASFDEVLRRADVYCVDNSSSLFEFASTSRPVVVLNQPAYRRSVEHGLRFWAASGVGVNAESPDDLPDAIATAIDDPPHVRAAREAALDIVYQPRSGGAALAAAALVDWASSVEVAPAVVRRQRGGPLYERTRRHLTPAVHRA